VESIYRNMINYFIGEEMKTFEKNKSTGSFILIDETSNSTVGACMIVE